MQRRQQRRFLLSGLCLVQVALSTIGVLAQAGPASAQTVATEHEGAAALGLALRRLGTTKRVLMIGAHPDDENTAVLSELALREGAEVAYLSLTRGEGGQNLIGPELQEALGIIRSEELLAARRLDGARQFFTRAYDFGYSRSAEESLQHWPQDTVLADVVEVVRRFRPDVLLSVFSGTPRDGHGHHQVAGILARAAYAAAGDPAAFPEQIRAGLRVHQPAHLLQAAWRPDGSEPVRMSIGDYDPLLGRSNYQIAMASRSRHRSQDMGQPEPIGPRTASIAVLAGEITAGGSMFAGLDTTLSALAASTISQSSFPPPHVEALRAYEAEITRARDAFNPLRPTPLVPLLARAYEHLQQADHLSQGHEDLRFAIAAEKAELEDAFWAAAGLVFDAQVETPRVVPGQEFTIALTVLNGGAQPVLVRVLEPLLPAGWQATPQEPLPGQALEPGSVRRRTFRVNVAANEPPTEPYYLHAPRVGDLYTWPQDTALRALPFDPPRVRAFTSVVVAGATLERTAEAVYLEIDKASGERRRPVAVVPAVDVAIAPAFAVIPLADPAAQDGNGAAVSAREITVAVTSANEAAVTGTLRLELPGGWSVDPPEAPLQLRAGERREVRFRVSPPAAPAPGAYPVRAVFHAADGRAYDRGHTVIDYPHTRPRQLYRAASTAIAVFPVALAADLRVGYIEGAGDDGALALRQLGADVTPLDAATLARGDLSRYHAIVLGIRAYEVRQDLIAHNARLLEYARTGGTVVVQYNKYEYPQGRFAPYELSIGRPHGRVTDEAAAVRLLDPDHAALGWPNRISDADFSGWVQERGLYFAESWDERYVPLLEMADPGEPPQRGSLLVARVGDGWYVYTGLALFRQLPEGVPGAYRLLANLVSLGRRP